MGTPNSLETILTLENKDSDSEWSVMWSTTNVPGMDRGTGGRPRRCKIGRRRLRMGALVLGSFLTMHCRVTAAALVGGYYIFMIVFLVGVWTWANPLRHFEVYLGQWSISGPGRAFRIIPMFDGIGIAICMNAILHAICNCTTAAIAIIYVAHAVSDERLPYKFCRDFNLASYEPIKKDISTLRTHKAMMAVFVDDAVKSTSAVTVGTYPLAWRNRTYLSTATTEVLVSNKTKTRRVLRNSPKALHVCRETYTGGFPPMYRTPAYNFFYVEVMRVRPDYDFWTINIPLLVAIVGVWVIMWAILIMERLFHGKLIWNNVYMWLLGIPIAWALVVLIISSANFMLSKRHFRRVLKLGSKDVYGVNALPSTILLFYLDGYISHFVTFFGGICAFGVQFAMTDGMIISIYIHASSLGTELILGKGLNHFASGHVDPFLNAEILWHSVWLCIIVTINTAGAAMCAIIDYIPQNSKAFDGVYHSTLWILPMYSKCAGSGTYSHLASVIIFGGISFSYMVSGFLCIKSALHTIFEYRIKLVFVEQVIVFLLITTCLGLSLPFATSGGLPLLESIETLLDIIIMPLVCLMELSGLLYVYRGRDFVSDLNLSMEDNDCSTRISTLWHVTPLITVVLLIAKCALYSNTEIPRSFVFYSLGPLLAVILAIPLRAAHNAYVFLKPAPRHGL